MGEPTPFGRWLKLRRATLDLTQPALADRAGCSPSLLRKIESGARRPTRQIAERLIGALDVPADQRDALMALALEEPALSPTADQYPDRLPALPYPLIGRDADLASLCQRLVAPDARLISVLGPPGVGKTSLAIAAAAAVRPVFDDGVCFVDLAPQGNADLALREIARACGVREAAEVPLAETLAKELRDRHMLLVLDNCEHLSALGRVIAWLLRDCPRLRVLATSRTPLRLRVERRFPLEPLALPIAAEAHIPAVVQHAPATAMFLDRAMAVAAPLRLDAESAPVVAAICTRLDGLPLAIELAAAHMDTLALPALLAQIERHWALQIAGPLDMPDRQQTLAAAISWSYALLTPAARRAFARLGVFVGSFAEAEAAQVVGADVALIPSLADQHLVRREPPNDGPHRYRLLETLRAFALEQLAAMGEEADARQRHALAYAELAEQAWPEFNSPRAHIWLARLDADLENVRAAMTWSLAHNEGVIATRITARLHTYWMARGLWSDGYRIIALLEADTTMLEPTLCMRALYTVGFMLSQQSSTENTRRATEIFQKLRRLSRAHGDIYATVRVLTMLAMTSRYPGNYAHVRALLEEGLTLVEASDLGLQVSLHHQMGMLLVEAGHDQEAVYSFEEALRLSRETNRIVSIAHALPGLAEAQMRLGQLEAAYASCEEAIALAEEHHIPEAAAEAHYLQGRIAFRTGRPVEARPLYTTSLDRLNQIGTLTSAARVMCSLGHLALAEDATTEAAEWFRSALQTGYDIFLIEVIGYSLCGLAAVAAAQGDGATAARLLGAADAVHSRFALRTDPDDMAAREQATRLIIAQLGPAAFAAIRDSVYEHICMRLPRVAFETTTEAIQTLQLPALIQSALYKIEQ